MRRVIVVIAWGLVLAACSTTMPSLDFMKSAPQAETLVLESEPPGAEARTSLGQSCRTPCQLAVQPASEFAVTLALSGYQPQTVVVRPEAQGATPARLAPNPVHVNLQAVAPPKKPVPRKKTPVVAAARPAAPPPMASAAAMSAPTPASTAASAPAPTLSSSAETAPSATNYPWPSR
jgi:hypothetical protein